MLSLFQHWEDNVLLFETLRPYLVAFDEYPVENFYSILRARTNETDLADQIAFKAKEIDACKHELHSLKSVFVPPKTFNYSAKGINILKSKAAEFLATKFKSIKNHPNIATHQPVVKRQPKNVTKWHLQNLLGEKIVTNQVLSLGFTSVQQAPNATR